MLKAEADDEGYETFVIPDDIGGRFSVITPVGLLPIAVAGIDIDAMFTGLKNAYADLSDSDLEKNPAYAYAVCRRILQDQGYDVEMLVNYEPQMAMVAEWWKQLFGESEGKEGKGILPDSANFSTDLHSLGQFVQEGKKVLFETLLLVERPARDLVFPHDEKNADQMNYLSRQDPSTGSTRWPRRERWKPMSNTGHVPNLILTMEDMSAESFGYMCYFFFRAVAMSVLSAWGEPLQPAGRGGLQEKYVPPAGQELNMTLTGLMKRAGFFVREIRGQKRNQTSTSFIYWNV